jgi:hypothetical protein
MSGHVLSMSKRTQDHQGLKEYTLLGLLFSNYMLTWRVFSGGDENHFCLVLKTKAMV